MPLSMPSRNTVKVSISIPLQTSQNLSHFVGYQKVAQEKIGLIFFCQRKAQEPGSIFFLTAIWLSHGQLWAILRGTALLTRC